MKVVVAGLPNTGTEAIEVALTRLGYNVYGRNENSLQLAKEWGKVLNEHSTIDDIREMFKGVDAVADIPACYFWEEILRAYPDTKIIFTRHQSEEKWVDETADLIRRDHSDCDKDFLNMSSPTMRNINKRVVVPIERLVYGFSPPSLCSKLTINKPLLRKRYRAHNAHVMEQLGIQARIYPPYYVALTIASPNGPSIVFLPLQMVYPDGAHSNAPKDQLLMYDISEGWKPLCEFLGVTAPSANFPSTEDGKAVAKQRLETNPVYCKAKKEQKITVSLFLVAISAGVYKLAKSPPAVLERACDWLQDTIASFFRKT